MQSCPFNIKMSAYRIVHLAKSPPTEISVYRTARLPKSPFTEMPYHYVELSVTELSITEISVYRTPHLNRENKIKNDVVACTSFDCLKVKDNYI